MSIKDLFNSKGTPKIQKTVTSDELVKNVESSEYVEAKKKEFETFVPPIDFATASNFAKFGSAELYYEKAFERIYQYYPYDGTLAEKVEFENSSSYLDRYVFENLYPRTNGYVNFHASEYIDIFGGPHTASSGMSGKTLDSTFDYSMKYDEDKGRTSAFEFRGEDGITIEFWLKTATILDQRAICHVSGASGDILLQQVQDDVKLIMRSGSETYEPLFTAVLDTDWNHYAVSTISSSTGLTSKFYKNGQFVEEVSSAKNIPDLLPTSDAMNIKIGHTFDGTLNKLTGSLDEFRFWKKERTSEQIFNNWFNPVGGGTNKFDSNLDLSLYLKFNEGITGTESIDKIVLDYSGRINNGTVSGYSSAFRSTDSAITEKLSQPEFKDPIIYSFHPDIVSTKAEYKNSGSVADMSNSSMFYRYMPSWMQEEDAQNGFQLKYLCQIMGNYFDTLWHQINFVDKVRDKRYYQEDESPTPFSKQVLENEGFFIPDLFVESTQLERLLNRDDNEVFEANIEKVKNTIYQNIYNNLQSIYKSKGTEKSFRNFFNSVGLGSNVVKLHQYADDSTFVARDNYEFISVEKRFVDFNEEGNRSGTIYSTSSAGNIYVPGDKDYLGSFSLESEIVLPSKSYAGGRGFFPYNQLTASIVGFHSTGSEYTHPATDYGLSVYVIKEKLEANLRENERQRVKFLLTGSSVNLETDFFDGQYDSNKWNISVKMKHENYPMANISGNIDDRYEIEFYGVEAEANTKRNYFLLSTSSVSRDFYSSDKIFYAGSHRTNFTGSSIYDTDIRLGSVRFWNSYLSSDAIDQHAYDPKSFGANNPQDTDLIDTYGIEIPREKTLSFHWGFAELTGSDSSGEFTVVDMSSGSSDSNYGSLSDSIQRYLPAQAEGFNVSSTTVFDNEYLMSARKRGLDNLLSSDLITIKDEEGESFFVDDDVSDNFYSFEKSLYGTISEEMLKMFSTAVEFNNLIGQPNQRYHENYGKLEFLRERFFEDVENDPDMEKFTSFYKWIDESIAEGLRQLTPAGARFSEKINNIVESHVLERSKYTHQIPVLTTFQSTEGSIKGVSEMKYNWQYGHAHHDPATREDESRQTLWHKERSEKEGVRASIQKTLTNDTSLQTSGLLRREIGGNAYVSDVYSTRRFAKTSDLSIVSRETIHGGTNFGRKKNLQLFHESIAPAGRLESVPQNVVTVGLGEGQGVVEEAPNNDFVPLKKKYQTNAQIGNKYGEEYGHWVHGDFVLPLNVMSGTVNSGFNAVVESLYKSGVHLTNLHNDIVGNYNETSVQGPFTEQHVGGLQYRHIDLNHGADNKDNRPEGWGLSIAEHPVDPSADGALGFVGADYDTGGYPSSTAPKATRYRDEHAKRPINVKNIKTVSGSWKAGNYKNELELFQISPTFQKTWAIEAYNNPDWDILPSSIANSLPDTTHYQTLIGVATYTSGNVFGVSSNNRQPDGNLMSAGSSGDYAKGSFQLSGATQVGTLSSGSFNLTGSPIAASYSTGSFEVTGANIQGTNAIGSFTMTSSWVPGSSSSNALFDVNGIDDANEGAVLVITQSVGSIFSYEIDLDNSLIDPGNTSISGATDRDFYNDFQTALSTDLPDYTVNYVEHPVTRSIAVSSSADSLSRLHSSAITNGGGGTAGYAISFWLYFDTFGEDRIKTIYEGRHSNGDTTKYIYIESGSLYFESVWRDNSGVTGDEFVDIWKITNFTSSYSQSLNHFSFSHSGSMGYGDQLKLYLNGVSSSALTVHAMSQSKGAAVPGPLSWVDLSTDEITLFAKYDGTNNLFPAGSTGPIYLDEVVVYPEARPHAHMVELYNSRKWQSSKPGNPTMIMDFEGLTVGTAITNSQVISDAGSNNNDLTASISSVGDLVPLTGSGTSLTIVKTPSSASFTISGAPVGANYNLTLNLSGVLGTFTNISNATGGVDNEGAADTGTITIDGQTFTITHSSPAGALEILATGSGVTDDVMWAELETKIEANTDYTVITGSDNPRTFSLTSVYTGSAEDPNISTSTTSFSIINAGTAGTDEVGAEDGDQLTLGSQNFLIDLTSGIGTGSTSDFHNALSQSIKDSTNFDTITINDLGNGYYRFDLTSSVASPSEDIAFTQNSNGSRATFQNLVSAAGGVTPAGIENQDRLTIGAVTFHLTESYVADDSTNKYIETTGSSNDIWSSLESKIESSFNLNVSITDLGDQALFEMTASQTGSANNFSLSEIGNSFTNLVNIAGGTDEVGIRDQDSISFGGFTFVLTASAPSPTPSYSYIETTGTSEQIWQALETEIEANTSFNVTTSSAGSDILFSLTASATGSSYNESILVDPDPSRSFFSISNIAGGTNPVAAVYGPDIVIEIPRTDLTGSERNITTRFSAPGGPEVQSIGYLDAYTSTYSVHNALPFRNLSVLGSGSGEQGTIRVEDHLGLRRGLKTLRALHMGKFGIDPHYGEITASVYPSSGSFGKQHRNTSRRIEYSGSTLITGSSYDNMHINSTLPRSEFQYSWINAATSGSHWYSENDRPEQHIYGYAPKDGIISSSAGWVEALVFPSASSITG